MYQLILILIIGPTNCQNCLLVSNLVQNLHTAIRFVNINKIIPEEVKLLFSPLFSFCVLPPNPMDYCVGSNFLMWCKKPFIIWSTSFFSYYLCHLLLYNLTSLTSLYLSKGSFIYPICWSILPSLDCLSLPILLFKSTDRHHLLQDFYLTS